MDLGLSKKALPLLKKVRHMINEDIIPLESEFFSEVSRSSNRFTYTPRMIEIIEGLKNKAKSEGLWNFWLTNSDRGLGLSTVEYAYLAEEMGKCRLGAEVFNCSAPDTGNTEVFARFGSKQHKQKCH